MNFLPDSEILPSHSDLFAQRSCRSILTHDRHRGDQAESVDKLRCDFENVPLVGSKFLPNSTTLSSFRTSVSLARLQFDPSARTHPQPQGSRRKTILVFGSCVDITAAKPSCHALNLYDGYCLVGVSYRVIFTNCYLL